MRQKNVLDQQIQLFLFLFLTKLFQIIYLIKMVKKINVQKQNILQLRNRITVIEFFSLSMNKLFQQEYSLNFIVRIYPGKISRLESFLNISLNTKSCTYKGFEIKDSIVFSMYFPFKGLNFRFRNLWINFIFFYSSMKIQRKYTFSGYILFNEPK